MSKAKKGKAGALALIIISLAFLIPLSSGSAEVGARPSRVETRA